MVYFLVYVSSAVDRLTEAELVDLLLKARENNQRLDVSGMLLYKDGNFMQVLEGAKSAVQSLYQKIVADPRHQHIQVLLQGEQAARDFPDWSMGFRNLTDPDVSALPGYSEFMNLPLAGAEFTGDAARSRKLLSVFKRNLR